MNYIDIHCHILPGMDDGPATLEESAKMLEIARNDGITHIFATPHVMNGFYSCKGSEIISSAEGLRKHLPAGLELLCGADVRIVADLADRVESGDILTLNNSKYLLLELPESIVPPHLDSFIFNLRQRGLTPVITHPERHLRLIYDSKALSGLRDAGAVSQITAMSITGGFGRDIMWACFSMIEKGLADVVASDAHNAGTRPPILSKAHKDVKKHFGDETANRLFFGNPGKILAG